MDLIVLESPNKIKDVESYARALGLDVRAVATVGHLLDLPPMAEGPAIDTRAFSLDRLQPRDQRAFQRIEQIRAAIGQADRVIVATDPDREGEAIAAEVWAWIPPRKAWRATFEEITQSGVERGLREMRPSLNTPAVQAAHARRAIDRLAGWHATAVAFEKLRQHRSISAGRLQSAALRLVVERHREQESFSATTTFGIRAKLRTASGAELFARLTDADGAPVVFSASSEGQAVTIPGRLTVTAIDAKEKEQRPRPPFEASSWLQVACKALGVSVKDATQHIQTLFEAGLTTYPRTDTVRVSDEAIAWARAEIERRFGAAYLPPVQWTHKDGGSSIVQGAHEAIRPTIPHNPGADLAERSVGPWGRVYGLIEARFLASQAAARVVDETTIRIRGGDSSFVARGLVETFDGWKRVLATDAEEETDSPTNGRAVSSDDEEDGRLPALAAGDVLEVVSTEITTHKTKPKPLFTQASLVAELKRLGIGRPSTYQSVVPLLLTRAWATEEAPATDGKSRKKSVRLPVLVPSPVGIDLCDFLCEAFPGLVDYDFTASMERALDEIEAGKRERVEVAAGWWSRFERELASAKTLKAQLPERKDLGACPKCATEGRAGRLRLISGVSVETKKGYEFAACDADTKDARICGHKAQVHEGELLEAPPCGQCGSPLRAINRKDGGRSWKCEEHGWFLAGKEWQLVVAPRCPECSAPMVHRERRDPKGEYFWACFSHKIFLDSDRFGHVPRRAKRGARG